MKSTIQKPDAGNPHVRFDEGEVASAATSRRGSLLYNKLMTFVAVAASATLPMAARAETHTLQPYAYVQSYGVNWIDTGYCAKPLSRYFIDYQLTESSTKGQGIFGNSSGSISCSLYIPNNTNSRTYWYYRDSGSTSYYWSVRDTQRRILTFTHPTTTSETGTMCLYNRTGKEEKTSTASHTNTSTVPLCLFSLGGNSYAAGNKKIFCFEAADSSTATTPTAFLAPATNDVGEAGFYDVIGGVFHGEANESASTALTYSDGVGSADDYKAEGGTLYAKFRAYAADDATGGVKFGSDAASGTAEAWVARGGMVTLTAVPEDGWEFAGWTGDTWALAGGSTMSDAMVTLTNASTAVQLLAKFRDPSWHWTGAAGDGSWFTPGNWADSDGVAATALASGDKFTFDQAGAVTVNYNPASAGFAIAKITFATGAGAVTVTNGEMHVAAIVVENGAENVMSNAVTFSGNIDVTATSGHVRFAGGATGSTIAKRLDLYGDFMLTQSSFYVPYEGTVLKSGSTLRTTQSTYGIQAHEAQYSMESATTTTVAHAVIDRNSSGTLMKRNDGVFVVTDCVRVDNNGNDKTDYFDNGGDGVLVAKRIRVEGKAKFVPPAYTVVGPEGIDAKADSYVRLPDDGAKRFGAYADWEMKGETDGYPILYKQSNTAGDKCVVTFETTDYYDSSLGRRITSSSPIGAYRTGNVSVVVTGIGTFAFACTNEYAKLFSGGLTVRDSATASVLAGAKPGAGAVTLSDTATLEVAESGAVTLGGALTLGDNATLAFNFTEKESAPQLVGTSATLPETTVNVKVTAADGLRVRGRPYTLTSGMDFSGKTVNLVDKPEWVRSVAVDAEGNLVLTTASKGLIISFY